MTIQLNEEHVNSLKLFVVLSKAQKTLMEMAVKDMKQHGMSESEFTILELLYTKGRIPLQQIGEKILITSGSITYNIDKLEQKGLLKRVPCESDRRVTFAEITPGGKALFDRIFPDHAAFIHSLVEVLSPAERQTATELLKKLGRGVEDK